MPVPGASVTINGVRATADTSGAFRLAVAGAVKYVVNIKKEGYAPYSQVHVSEMLGKEWILSPATIKQVDPRSDIRVIDVSVNGNCQGTTSSRVREAPNAISWNLTPQSLRAIEMISQPRICGGGVEIEIPANSLVDFRGESPTGPVNVAVSTVDLFTPESMPGDDTVLLPDYKNDDGMDARSVGERKSRPERIVRMGFMESFGAGSIEVNGVNSAYQLKKDAQAILTIPIHPVQLRALKEQGKDPDPVIPLLHYDEAAGVWRQEGQAMLNAGKDAYVAKISHFSTFNMDLVKTNQACIEVDSTGITSLSSNMYRLEITIPSPSGGSQIVRTKDVTNNPQTIHAIYNLPNDSMILGQLVIFRPFKLTSGSPELIGTFTATPGAPQTPSTNPPPENPAGRYYPNTCKGKVVLVESVSTGAPTLNAPIVTNPTPTAANVEVTWAYMWDANVQAHLSDQFVLEVSDSSSFSSVTSVMFSQATREPMKTYVITGLPLKQTRYFRVKAIYGALTAPASTKTSGIKFSYTGDPRSLVIKNKLPSSLADNAIVGLRLHPTNGLIGTEQLTGTPPSTCVGNPATPPDAQISSGADSSSVNVNTFAMTSPYSVYIGLGGWDPKTPAGSCFRREYYTPGGTKPPIYRYFNFVVQNHTIGPKTLTVVVEGGVIKLKDGIVQQEVITSGTDPTP